MDSRQCKADKANRAASDLGWAFMQTFDDLRSNLEVSHDLDDQLVMLAIAKASVGIAIEATAEIADMGKDECEVLEERIYEVIVDALS